MVALLAARVKASYSISFTNAFVVTSALEEQAVILTGDPEFKQLEGLVEVEWFKAGVKKVKDYQGSGEV
jgi:ribonuclease VapC